MTEREVSSERVSEERLERILDDARRKFLAADSQVMCRYWQDRIDIYTELLALRSSVKTVADFYAIHSATGSHIGLWNDEVFARNVLKEYEGGTITPLYTHPTPQGAPSEVTEDAVFRAMTKADDLDISLCDDDAREILTAALKGGK